MKKVNKKFSRKAQAEVVGILIVVVLVSLGMLLVAKFIMSKSASEEKQQFSKQQAAANSVMAMLKVKTDCRGLTLTELYQDCAKNYPLGSIKCEGTKRSCDYASEVAFDILQRSFDGSYDENNLNMPYYYTVKKSGETDIVPEIKHPQYDKKCAGYVESKKALISLSPGYLDVELSVC